MASTVTSAVCNSFKQEILVKTHDFTISTGNIFKIALVATGAAGNISYGASTTNAGTPGTGTPSQSNIGTDEQAASGTYSAGGFAWTQAQNLTPVLSGSEACIKWSVDPSWSSATISTIGAILYNSSASNKTVACFSLTASVTAGTLTLQQPAQTAGNAIIRIT